MANISPVSTSNAGAVVAAQNTASGGDEFVFSGGGLVLAFFNGHASPITVSFAPTQSNVPTSAGVVAVPTRSLAIPAGDTAVFRFTPENAGPYVNASGRIPVTYTGHNAALVVRALTV